METFSVEDRLSGWGVLLLVLSVAAGLGCLWVAGVARNQYGFQGWGDGGVSWPWVLAGVGTVLQGAVVHTLMGAFAEVIRLLRRLNDK